MANTHLTLGRLKQSRLNLGRLTPAPRLICVLVALATLCSCATNPVSGDLDFALISESKEIQQGREFNQQVLKQYEIYDDPDLQQYISRIGQALVAKSHRSDLPFTFTLLDSPEINAFALPGGYIYITRGILAYLNSEAELAGVLGHEIGHVTARHSVRQQTSQVATSLLGILVAATTGDRSLGDLSQQLGSGIIRGYGREHELEADRLGAIYLHHVGYDPKQMLEVIGVLKDQEVYEKALAKRENREPNIYHGVYSTHPRNDDRLKSVVLAARNLDSTHYSDPGEYRFHSKIDGLLWGPSIKQGVLVKNQLHHADLRFSIQFPNQWKVINRPDKLQALDPESGALLQMELVNRQPEESLSQLLQRISGEDSLQIEATSNGAKAQFQQNINQDQQRPVIVFAMPLNQQQVLTLFGTAAVKHFSDMVIQFETVSQSFIQLSAEKIENLPTPRLRLIKPAANQSFSNLAQQSALDYEAENLLRILNRAFPDGEITAIGTVKTILVDQ